MDCNIGVSREQTQFFKTDVNGRFNVALTN